MGLKMDFLVNDDELMVLCGLPHIQQLAYLRGIRPYMDVQTRIVGIKRRVSYQSIAEQLYVEPHQGIKSQSFSRDQVRRAVSGLVRAKVIEVKSEGMQLILKCHLATMGYSVQNKAAINPPQKATTKLHDETPLFTRVSENIAVKADITKVPNAATPLYKEDYYIFLLSQFEKFWSMYPEKKSKHSAQSAFELLNPDAKLFQQLINALQTQIHHRETMMLQGIWVPPWKYPANWLNQRSWEDEISTELLREKKNAEYTKVSRKRNTATDLFCPPSEFKDERPDNNVVEFKKYF